MWKRLLVPCDFSACADAALALAIELARTHGAELSLLHVSDLPPNLEADARITSPDGAASMRVADYVTRGAATRLEAVAKPAREAGLRVSVRAVTGDVATEILRTADEQAASALVIGTHGRTGLSHLLLGSVAEKVVRAAKVPVVTVRLPGPEARATEEERAAEDELAG
jgi:nucleotide-binding universal stress UspA family protein